jgi:acyl carrier protein
MIANASVERRIRKILSEQLLSTLPTDREAVTMNAMANWDSMAQVQIVVAIESEFQIEADVALIEAQTLDALVDNVSSRIGIQQVQVC